MGFKDKLNKFLQWFYELTTAKSELLLREQRIYELENELGCYTKQINYSFIPDGWKKVEVIDVVTSKTRQDGIDLDLDIRDLLNSTVYSRRVAYEVLDFLGPRKKEESEDLYFKNIALEVANRTIVSIEYVTNQSQFNVADKWTNGDSAIVTKKGDCDISVRAFVRVLNDCLDKIKMFEYKKYVFLAVGYFLKTGHAWGMVYDPVDSEFKLIEATKDTPLTELEKVPYNYDLWFCHNFKNIYYQNEGWKKFL